MVLTSRSSSTLYYALFTILPLFSPTTTAKPLTTPAWLNPLLPERGNSIQDELKCYSLPYGAIGFVSHCLTYWTVFMLARGRSPILLRPLSATTLGVILATLQLLGTVTLAAISIARCRERWQFVLISVWKLCFSLELGVWGVMAALVARRNPVHHHYDDGHKCGEQRVQAFAGPARFLTIVYIIPLLVGAIGLFDVVDQTIHQTLVFEVTLAFGVAAAAVAIVALFCFGLLLLSLCDVVERIEPLETSFAICGSVFLMLFAFYSDWVLGAIAGDIVGTPGSDNGSLYWVSEACE